MAKYDWETVEDEYVFGYINNEGQRVFPTHTELSKKHNIPRGTIGSRASKDKWEQRKQAASRKIKQKVDEKKSEYDAENIVLSDDKFESAGELIRRVAVKKLESLEEDLDDPDKFVRSIDIMNASNSVRIGQEIVKTAQGEILQRIGVETNNNGNDELLNDPDYIAAKRKAMDDFYHAKSRKS